MKFRTRLIKIVTFLGGIYFFLKFILPESVPLFGGHTLTIAKYNEEISTALIALTGMSLGLGLINLVMRHGLMVAYLRRGWIDSVALLAGLGIMLTLSTLEWRSNLGRSEESRTFFMLRDFSARIIADVESNKVGVPPFAIRERALKESAKQNLSALAATLASEVSLTPQERALNEEVRSVVIDAQKEVSLLMPEGVIDDGLKIHHKKISASFGELGSKVNEYLTLVHGHSTQKRAYDLFFQGIFVSLGSAMFSLLGFYIASAAYRAFRVRSTESALMMGAALLVILGQIPFALFGSGPFGEYLHELFPRIRLWLLTVPNTAAFRAIEIGSAVGALIMGVRMWFSIESESFSEGEKR